MPPRDYRKEYKEKLSAFKNATASYEVSPVNAKLLADAYMDIRRVTLMAVSVGVVFDEGKQDRAFIAAADKFGKDFWSDVTKVPKSFVDHYIRQFRDEMRVAAGSHGEYDRDQITQRYYDAMELAGKSIKKVKSDALEEMYYEAKHLIGKERADRVFEMHPKYYGMVPNLSALHKEEQDKLHAEQRRAAAEKQAARSKQLDEENEQMLEEFTAKTNTRAQQQREAEEARYDAMEDANGIIERAFKKEDLSERLIAFLEKKEADIETVDKDYAGKSKDTKKEIKKAISEDIKFLEDLQGYTKRLYEYGQGDNMGPVDSTVRNIQAKLPAQLERLFSTLPKEKPGSMEHKDRLEMIQACGSMIVNTQRFANTAAENGTPLKDVEFKNPMDTVRQTLKLFSKELDRIPKDDDDSELFTTFKDALKEAANGGSIKNLWDASSDYYNGRRGIIFGPFTEVGKHRLHMADHVYEFLKDVKWKTLEKESERWAETLKAAAPKVGATAEKKLNEMSNEARVAEIMRRRENMNNSVVEETAEKFGVNKETVQQAFDTVKAENNVATNESEVSALDQPQVNAPTNSIGGF